MITPSPPRSRLDYAPGEAPEFICEARRVTEQCIMIQANVPREMAARLAFFRWLAQRRGATKER